MGRNGAFLIRGARCGGPLALTFLFGFSAPLTDAAMTQASTAWESKDCFDLLLVFLRPYVSRSSLVWYPWHKWTVKPISRKRWYKCSLPTCTGLNDLFHFPPLPGRVTACTSSMTTSVSGKIFCNCMTTRAFASQRLRVEGGMRCFLPSRLSKRLGRRHLRKRRARRIVLRVSTASLT